MNFIDRRTFLGRSGVLAGSAALGNLALEARALGGAFTGKMKKAVKFHMVLEDKMSVLDKFKMLHDLGFDGTEIRSREIKEISDKGIYSRKEIEVAISKTGLPVHGVVNSSDPDLTTAIELSGALGGTSILTVCRYDRKLSLRENWERDQATIRKGIPAAEKHGVKILVENVWASYLISAFDVERFLDEIDSPWVGSYFDVGNNVRWGVAEHWVKHLGKRIVKLDIKEYDIGKQRNEGLGAGFKVPLGEGSIDWAAVRAQLGAIGFEGWATAEIPGGGRERLAEIAERMDRVLDIA